MFVFYAKRAGGIVISSHNILSQKCKYGDNCQFEENIVKGVLTAVLQDLMDIVNVLQYE